MPNTKPIPDDPAQSQRFIDMAREVEADEDPKAMERALEKVMPSGSHPHHSEKPRGE